MLCYKNIPFKEQLQSYLDTITEPDEWCMHQDEMLNHTIELGQDDWVIALGLDAGKKVITLLVKCYCAVYFPIGNL